MARQTRTLVLSARRRHSSMLKRQGMAMLTIGILLAFWLALVAHG
jgi:uncharacterized protein YjeT (DUF2065 family)